MARGNVCRRIATSAVADFVDDIPAASGTGEAIVSVAMWISGMYGGEFLFSGEATRLDEVFVATIGSIGS